MVLIHGCFLLSTTGEVLMVYHHGRPIFDARTLTNILASVAQFSEGASASTMNLCGYELIMFTQERIQSVVVVTQSSTRSASLALSLKVLGAQILTTFLTEFQPLLPRILEEHTIEQQQVESSYTLTQALGQVSSSCQTKAVFQTFQSQYVSRMISHVELHASEPFLYSLSTFDRGQVQVLDVLWFQKETAEMTSICRIDPKIHVPHQHHVIHEMVQNWEDQKRATVIWPTERSTESSAVCLKIQATTLRSFFIAVMFTLPITTELPVQELTEYGYVSMPSRLDQQYLVFGPEERPDFFSVGPCPTPAAQSELRQYHDQIFGHPSKEPVHDHEHALRSPERSSQGPK